MLVSDAIDLLILSWDGLPSQKSRTYQANRVGRVFQGRTLEDLTDDDLLTYRDILFADGLDPYTVHHHMIIINSLYRIAKDKRNYKGPKPNIPYPHRPKKEKWWMNDATQAKIIAWAEQHGARLFSYYVMWARLTGLRIEESLRVQGRHLMDLETDRAWLMVPGTKTKGAQATLPLSQEAANLAKALLAGRPDPDAPLFQCSYDHLRDTWLKCRAYLGITLSSATLKAMRRTYARDRAAKKCPLPLLQQLMRHKNPATTLEYLRLTGGQFTDDELRPFI